MGVKSEIWLAIRSDISDGTGSGTPSDPFAVNTPSSFGTIMRDQAANMRIIRLLPGVYQTWGQNKGNGYDLSGIIPAVPTFVMRNGQKIVGSGCFSTVIRFVWKTSDFNIADPIATYDPGQRHQMMASADNDFLDSPFEISDLTLDCNLQNLPGFTKTKGSQQSSGTITGSVTGTTMTTSATFFDASMEGSTVVFSDNSSARITRVWSGMSATLSAPLTVSGLAFTVFGVRLTVKAISVLGDNLLIRRVRVINFGTLTPYYCDGLSSNDAGYLGGPNRTYEGFPLGFGGRTGARAAFNNVAEGCIFEQPFAVPGREVTCAVVGGGINGGADPARGERLHLQPMGCAIRNCYFNFEYTNPRPGSPVRIAGSVYNPTTADVTVSTEVPADVQPGDFVEITGSDKPALIGRWLVKAPLPDPDPTSKLQLSFTVGAPSTAGGAAAIGFAMKSPAQTMPLQSLARDGTTTSALATTWTPHKRAVNDWVCISGVANDDHYNGTFRVTDVDLVNGLWFKFDLGGAPDNGTASGDMWVDRRPNSYVFIQNVTTDPTTLIATLTTYGPHYLKPGDWVPISGVAVGSPATTNNAYNNYVQVLTPPLTETNTRRTLYVQLYSALNIGAASNLGGAALFSGGFQAMTGNGGYGGGLLSNRVANCVRGGTYHDFWWENQFLGRRNYLYNVFAGPLMVFGPGSTYANGDPHVSTAFRWGTVTAVVGSVVTVALDSPGADPGYVQGLAIRASVGQNNTPAPAAPYFDAELLSVGFNSSTNKYEMTFNQPSNVFSTTAPNNIATIDLWFQQSLYLFEDNVVELALEQSQFRPQAAGIVFLGPYWQDPNLHGFNNGAKYPWLLQSGIIRDNHVRKVGGVLDPGPDLSGAISFDACRNLIAEGNVFPLMNAGTTYTNKVNVFVYSNSMNVKAFNNQTPDGQLWRFYNDPRYLNNNDNLRSEIQTTADDMLWIGKLNTNPI